MSWGRQRSTHSPQLSRQLSLPNLFFNTAKCSGPRLVQCSPACFPPPIAMIPQIVRRVRETKCSLLLVASALDEPGLVPRASVAFSSRPVAHSAEVRPSLAGEKHDLASPTRVFELSCMVPRRELRKLPVRVSSTILEARSASNKTGRSSLTGVLHVVWTRCHVMCPT